MWYIIYFFIAVGATTIGSVTGMGGGVMMKPVLDVLHNFDVETIGMLSSITVLFMSLVSIGKQMHGRTRIPFDKAIPLAAGSVVGGYLGQNILKRIVTYFRAEARVLLIQNVILGVLILLVWFYMEKKDRILGWNLSGIKSTLPVGCFLGICSSFLGIGGGPINVALLIYLYSMSTKTAAACSLITILFAQVSKLLTVAATSGFKGFDLSMAPVMIVGAVIGGYLGAILNKYFSEQKVEKVFNMVQLGVLGIVVWNVMRNL